jgi:hypothetical protein
VAQLAQLEDRACGPGGAGRADPRRAAAGPHPHATTSPAVQYTPRIVARAGPASIQLHHATTNLPPSAGAAPAAAQPATRRLLPGHTTSPQPAHLGKQPTGRGPGRRAGLPRAVPHTRRSARPNLLGVLGRPQTRGRRGDRARPSAWHATRSCPLPSPGSHGERCRGPRPCCRRADRQWRLMVAHLLTTWCAIEVGTCWPGRSGLGGGQRRAARSETSPAMARWVSA